MRALAPLLRNAGRLFEVSLFQPCPGGSVASASASVPWQRSLVVLTGTVVFAVLIASMYWAQVVFIPAAMGIFLAFLLNPLVRGLQHRGLGRLPAVILAVLTGTLVMGALGWLAVGQFTALINDLPTYTPNIKKKIEAVQQLGAGSPIEHMIKEITEQLKPEVADIALGEPTAVVVQPD